MRNHSIKIRRLALVWMCVLGGAWAAPARAQRAAEGASGVMHSTLDGAASIGTANPELRGLSAGQIGGGIAVGLAGGTLLAVGGAAAGAASASGCRGEYCELGPAALGFLVGESIGIATGAHLGAGGHGNLLLETLASTAITAVGVAVLIGNHNGASSLSSITIGLVPIVQLATVLAMESR